MDIEKKELIQRLEAKGMKDKSILRAIQKVPRERFVSEKSKSLAYTDVALPIGSGQTISQPYIIAKMLTLLELNSLDKVLEIGSGSGYVSALLANITKSVIGIEKDEELVKSSKKLVKDLGYNNIKILRGDGSRGYPAYHPYQKIIVSAALPEIPPILIKQLADPGIIVAPVGNRMHQKLVVLKKIGKKTYKEEHDPCIFLPVRGEYGF